MRNNVTGGIFKADFGTNGQRLVRNVTQGRMPEQSEIGAALENGLLGLPTAYVIRNGRILTYFGNAPFEMAVYKAGDKLYAARSNEFGFANYEIIPTPIALNPEGVPPGASL